MVSVIGRDGDVRFEDDAVGETDLERFFEADDVEDAQHANAEDEEDDEDEAVLGQEYVESAECDDDGDINEEIGEIFFFFLGDPLYVFDIV